MNDYQTADPSVEQAGFVAQPDPVLSANRRLELDARRLRAAAGAFAALVAITLVWVLFQGWSQRLILELFLFTSLAGATAAFAFRAAQLLVDEPASEVLRVVFGEPLGVRSTERFMRRLKHECNDGQLRARNRTFSLVVVGTQRIAEEPASPVTHLRDGVRTAIRSRDVMGEVGAHELWVLALGADADAAQTLCRRLATTLQLAPDDGDGISPHIGWSSFGFDASDPHTLMRAARYRASLFNPEEQPVAKAA